jgi:hypothetical protein
MSFASPQSLNDLVSKFPCVRDVIFGVDRSACSNVDSMLHIDQRFVDRMGKLRRIVVVIIRLQLSRIGMRVEM